MLLQTSGDWLRHHRSRLNMTQADLEVATNGVVKQWTISRIEQGEQRPTEAQVTSLAEGLQMRPDDLLIEFGYAPRYDAFWHDKEVIHICRRLHSLNGNARSHALRLVTGVIAAIEELTGSSAATRG